jgi:YidC/Oxa1 family membrane protein insertase
MQRNPIDPNDSGQQKRLIVAIVLSLLILFGFHFLFERPRLEAQQAREHARQEAAFDETARAGNADQVEESSSISREEALSQTRRINISNDKISGSLPLRGNRLDDIQLLNYYKTVDSKENVELFKPSGTERPYYAEFGWIAEGGGFNLPGKDTTWDVVGSNENLTAGQPVLLRWDNGQGLVFERKFEVDEHYLFTVTDRIINQNNQPVTLYPYQLLSRSGLPDDYMKIFILHQGPIGYTGEDLKEFDYSDLEEGERFTADAGWVGFTDKYWFAGLIPPQGKEYKARFVQTGAGNVEKARFQTDIRGEAVTVMPEGSTENTFNIYVGAKELNVLNEYSKRPELRNLELSLDFGILFFITKPFYLALKTLSTLFGHVAWGIIVLTVLIRFVLYPLNNKSFRSMAAMKKVTPKLKEIQAKHKEDPKVMQTKIMELYQKEKVNPFSGCWPVLLQIPIFFALYKVIMLDIDMRHAPFPGWIEDMSVMDPTSLFNMFGLLPYSVPELLTIGVWPCLMGVTMFLQRRLNPPPTDPMQAKLMFYMPFIFTVILAKFAAGLVIYWTWSNTLGIIQQYIIMRRMGVDVSLVKGYKGDPEAEKPDAKPENAEGKDALAPKKKTEANKPKPKKGKKKD